MTVPLHVLLGLVLLGMVAVFVLGVAYASAVEIHRARASARRRVEALAREQRNEKLAMFRTDNSTILASERSLTPRERDDLEGREWEQR